MLCLRQWGQKTRSLQPGHLTLHWRQPKPEHCDVVFRIASTIPPLRCFSSFSGLCLRGCGAIFGKYQHRGFLWPCSGPSFLSLFATVYFTGPCTLTQLLTLILWSRKSDGWKPKFFEWHCPRSEGLLQPPWHLSFDAWVKRGWERTTSYFLSLVNKVLLSLSKPITRSSLPLPWSLWQQGLIPELGRHSSTSHLASLLTGTWEAPSTTACKEPGSSEDVVWATSEGCHVSSPNLSDWQRLPGQVGFLRLSPRSGLLGPGLSSKSSLGKWEKTLS